MPSSTRISYTSTDIPEFFDLTRRQNIRPKVTTQYTFAPKELRQIAHFLRREMGEDYYFDVEGGCSCGVCPDISQYVLAEAALSDSKVYKKFKEMAHKYDLHITIQRDTGRIWATKKGIENGKVPSVEKGR